MSIPADEASKRASGVRLASSPIWIALFAGIAFAPALGAGFLNYDDPWLFIDNPLLAPASWGTPLSAFFDFSHRTRMALGAEYLPMRDLLVWLETRCFGMNAGPLHAVSLALYLSAALFMRGALVRSFGRTPWVELAALWFAVHPVHAESVAWLAGQKDVLALFFVGAALYVHAGEGAWRRLWVPLLVLAASLSKSMSVAVVGLLVAQDLALRRKPDKALYAGALFAVAATMSLHVYVGRMVGMMVEPLGGSRATALISMGPVWLRYLGLCLFPWQLSIAHDVPVRTTWDLPALLGYAFVLTGIVGSALALKRGRPWPMIIALWFFVPLIPVSQVLVPLQNRMADRYLWLSVMAPCLVLAWALARAAERAAWRGAARIVVGLAALISVLLVYMSLQRTVTFSDSVLLFADGTRKTEKHTAAPYQLGKALEERGQDEEAMLAFREVLRRAPPGHWDRRTATNNLARLLARHGRLGEAERVLRSALAEFPKDAKLKRNLAKVLRGMGKQVEPDGAATEQGP